MNLIVEIYSASKPFLFEVNLIFNGCHILCYGIIKPLYWIQLSFGTPRLWLCHRAVESYFYWSLVLWWIWLTLVTLDHIYYHRGYLFMHILQINITGVSFLLEQAHTWPCPRLNQESIYFNNWEVFVILFSMNMVWCWATKFGKDQI